MSLAKFWVNFFTKTSGHPDWIKGSDAVRPTERRCDATLDVAQLGKHSSSLHGCPENTQRRTWTEAGATGNSLQAAGLPDGIFSDQNSHI
jgi:hypothetical protein